MNIYESAEDYLEMILRLHKTKGYARAVVIANGLSVSKPSVSIAMRNLRESGYIIIDSNNHIHLTEAGMAVADRIFERHTLLTQLFIVMGVDADTAESDACKVEHDLSAVTFEAIKRDYEKRLSIPTA